MSRRSQPSFETLCITSKDFYLLLGCLLCVFHTAFGDVDAEKSNSTSEDLKHAKRSVDFPTLFYPGPDNKFVTLSPPPVLPEFVTVFVNGRKETFKRPKSMAPNHNDLMTSAPMDLIAPSPPSMEEINSLEDPSMHDGPEVETVIVRHPQALHLKSHKEFQEVVSMRTSMSEGMSSHEGGEEDENHEASMEDVARGRHLFQRLPAVRPNSENVQRSRPSKELQQARRAPPSRKSFRPKVHSADGGVRAAPQKGKGEQSFPILYYRGEQSPIVRPTQSSRVQVTSGSRPIGRAPSPPPRATQAPHLQHYSVRPLYKYRQDDDDDDEQKSEAHFRPPVTTRFSCDKLTPGYYADIETGCQMFHVCHHGRKHTFTCPDKTLFNQQLSVCDWAQRVTCRPDRRRQSKSNGY